MNSEQIDAIQWDAYAQGRADEAEQWREFIANAQAPETAESVQESAIAENQSMQTPYR